MSVVQNLLDEVDSVLKERNFENYDRLQKPLPDNDIQMYFEQLGLKDKDVFSFYKWKNGVDTTVEKCMLFDLHLAPNPLSEVLNIKNSSRFEDVSNFLALFDSPDGECFLFNNTQNSEEYGMLYLYSVPLLSIDQPYSYYDSLELLLRTTIELYTNEAFVYDVEKKFLEPNLDKVFAISSALNPKSSYWKSV